jgi:hypothetical protein
MDQYLQDILPKPKLRVVSCQRGGETGQMLVRYICTYASSLIYQQLIINNLESGGSSINNQ